MDYPQILSPIISFLHCPTPQAWIDEARKPENLPLLLTDHMVCELKAAQNPCCWCVATSRIKLTPTNCWPA